MPAVAVFPSATTGPLTGLQGATVRPLAERITELEHSAIAEALLHTGGNRTAAARLLGISRASLYDRLETMGESTEKQTIV